MRKVYRTMPNDMLPSSFISKRNMILLCNQWNLEPDLMKYVVRENFYITHLDNYLENIELEDFPQTYQDIIKVGSIECFITYIYCSGEYLECLCEKQPKRNIAIKTRYLTNERNIALVRLWDRTWKEYDLIKQGAVRI
jgi:hypothetical protein